MKVEIPEEILCTGLICLNKCAVENGKLENIRPISINSCFIKLLDIKTRTDEIMFMEQKM